MNSLVRALSRLFLCALCTATWAVADTYVSLSGASPLTCVFAPNGKTQIANRVGTTYRRTTFERATKAADKARAKTRDKIKSLNAAIRQLEKQRARGASQANLDPKQVRALFKLFNEGKITADLTGGINDFILSLRSARDYYTAEVSYYTQLMNLIKQCKNKTLPESGSVDIVYETIVRKNYIAQGDSSGEGYVVAFAKVPYEIAAGGQSGYFCFERPPLQGGGALYKPLSSNPCFTELLSELPGTCDRLRERDDKGKPLFYYAALAKANFYFKERIGGVRLEEAARATEARLRMNANSGGWELATRWFKVSKVDKCVPALFQ